MEENFINTVDENLEETEVEDGNTIEITNADGQTEKVEVLDIFTLENYPDKEYILYTKGEVEGDFEKTYVSILVDTDEEVILETIEDPDELKSIEDYINSIDEDYEDFDDNDDDDDEEMGNE